MFNFFTLNTNKSFTSFYQNHTAVHIWRPLKMKKVGLEKKTKPKKQTKKPLLNSKHVNWKITPTIIFFRSSKQGVPYDSVYQCFFCSSTDHWKTKHENKSFDSEWISKMKKCLDFIVNWKKDQMTDGMKRLNKQLACTNVKGDVVLSTAVNRSVLLQKQWFDDTCCHAGSHLPLRSRRHMLLVKVQKREHPLARVSWGEPVHFLRKCWNLLPTFIQLEVKAGMAEPSVPTASLLVTLQWHPQWGPAAGGLELHQGPRSHGESRGKHFLKAAKMCWIKITKRLKKKKKK